MLLIYSHLDRRRELASMMIIYTARSHYGARFGNKERTSKYRFFFLGLVFEIEITADIQQLDKKKR